MSLLGGLSGSGGTSNYAAPRYGGMQVLPERAVVASPTIHVVDRGGTDPRAPAAAPAPSFGDRGWLGSPRDHLGWGGWDSGAAKIGGYAGMGLGPGGSLFGRAAGGIIGGPGKGITYGGGVGPGGAQSPVGSVGLGPGPDAVDRNREAARANDNFGGGPLGGGEGDKANSEKDKDKDKDQGL